MPPIIINGVATSYDLPQYIGEVLVQKRERPNAFLRLVGGLSGGNIRIVRSTEFPLGVDYEVPAGSQPAHLEGADPVPSELGTTQGTNIVQIFQYAVQLTYSAQGNSGAIGGLAVIPGVGNTGGLTNPISLVWQIDRKLEQMQNDVNYSILRGTFQQPATNATARRMRGLTSAITTHRYGNAGTARPLTKALIESVLRSMVVARDAVQAEEFYVLGDATQIERVAALWTTDAKAPESRVVVGVAIRQIITFWGTINLVYEPDMAPGTLLFTRPGQCRPVVMPVPNGLIFVEPLAKTGASNKNQLYGELSIDYRSERLHGLLVDLAL